MLENNMLSPEGKGIIEYLNRKYKNKSKDKDNLIEAAIYEIIYLRELNKISENKLLTNERANWYGWEKGKD